MFYIYKATNKINGKSYIGFTENYIRRKKAHESKQNSLKYQYFHSAIQKYGKENFEWSILFESEDKEYTLKVKEPELINEYNTFENGYNLTQGGDGGTGYKHTDEARKKMSEIAKKRKVTDKQIETLRKNALKMKETGHTPEARQKIREANHGKIVSEETRKKIGNNTKKQTFFQTVEYREKMSKSCLGKKRSQEMKQKLSNTAKGRKLLIREDGSKTWIYPNRIAEGF